MEIIKITGSGSELQGVGHLQDGRAVFVPGALPDETVRIEITRDGGRFCEARMVEILEASPMRRSSDCECYERCGGCAARHMNYNYTLELKRRRVFDALKRLGGIEEPPVYRVIGCAEPDHTRNKAEYAVSVQEGHVQIGSYAPKSRKIVPLDHCLLQKAPSIAVLNWMHRHLAEYSFANHIRYLVTRVNRKGEIGTVLCGDAPVQNEVKKLAANMFRDIPELISLHFCKLRMRPVHALDGICTLISGKDTMHDTLMDLDFELSPQSFFQVNPEQTEVLYRKALEAAIPEGCNDSRILDIYCGAGTITLSAAKRAAFATGVEIVAPAIENAKRNAQANSLADKTRFICGDAAREIPRLIAKGERFDSVILDPPRKGADTAVLDALIRAALPRIAYVSCNPSTLARDVKILYSGGYSLEWAQPVDMFPWTEHVETVCLLSKLHTEEHIEIDLVMDELDVTAAEQKATYEEIKAYVKASTGLKVSSLYIAQVKEKCGIIERQCYNKPKSEKGKAPLCPLEKEKAIMDALRHYGMI